MRVLLFELKRKSEGIEALKSLSWEETKEWLVDEGSSGNVRRLTHGI